jgi:hypothetical protein
MDVKNIKEATAAQKVAGTLSKNTHKTGKETDGRRSFDPEQFYILHQANYSGSDKEEYLSGLDQLIKQSKLHRLEKKSINGENTFNLLSFDPTDFPAR